MRFLGGLFALSWGYGIGVGSAITSTGLFRIVLLAASVYLLLRVRRLAR